jgi:hypothetical protein
MESLLQDDSNHVKLTGLDRLIIPNKTYAKIDLRGAGSPCTLEFSYEDKGDLRVFLSNVDKHPDENNF